MGGHDDLKYATLVGSTWYTSTVDSTGNVGGYTSIALNTNGDTCISYYDFTNHSIKYVEGVNVPEPSLSALLGLVGVALLRRSDGRD